MVPPVCGIIPPICMVGLVSMFRQRWLLFFTKKLVLFDAQLNAYQITFGLSYMYMLTAFASDGIIIIHY